MTATMTRSEGRSEKRTGASVSVQGFFTRHSALMPTFAALAILLLLFAGAEAFLRGDFITPRNISALLLDNAYLLILAVGMTFVIVTGGIDLSVGSVMAFTGILGAKLLAEGMPVAIAIPVILAGGAVIGLIIGVLVQYFNVQPFIASLAGLFLARGLAFVVSLSSIKVEEPAILWLQSTRFSVGGWYITPTGIIALLAVAVAAFVMHLTRMGRTVYAIGGSESSARLMGLKVARTKVMVYVISGFCAGLAGLVLTAYSGAGYPRNGIGTELDAIAAVVIGGTLLTGGRGYVIGSMIGVFVYGTIKTIITFMGAEQSWMQIIVGALLLLFIVVQRAIVARSEGRG
ncbi:sugar ABC transporter permease YjfF [Demequina sp. NBRC 110052]|uniref:ABC transporter permease subunit n=1 Tax=Demequina sp. NBRC 110052 TaxID=1570341 RepID=UPI000A01FA39|nr:sugar ABC transporter permease YjfF [Demequina sp. NBRC 110052]